MAVGARIAALTPFLNHAGESAFTLLTRPAFLDLCSLPSSSPYDLFVGGADPAGAKAHALRLQNDLFAIVAAQLVKVLKAALAGHDNIIAHSAEMTVARHPALKSLGLIRYKLNVKTALLIALPDQRFQLLQVLACDGPVVIGSDRMSLLYCFSDIHDHPRFGAP